MDLTLIILYTIIINGGVIVSAFLITQWKNHKKFNQILLAMMLSHIFMIGTDLWAQIIVQERFMSQRTLLLVLAFLSFMAYLELRYLCMFLVRDLLEESEFYIPKGLIRIIRIIYFVVLMCFVINIKIPIFYSYRDDLLIDYTVLFKVSEILLVVPFYVLTYYVLKNKEKMSRLNYYTALADTLTYCCSVLFGMLFRTTSIFYIAISIMLFAVITMKQVEIMNRLAENRQKVLDMEREKSAAQIKLLQQELIEKDLHMASQIQLDSLPKNFPPYEHHRDIKLYATIRPQKLIGGDFYDCFEINENHVGFLIADVSGKGISAALFMMKAKTIIRSFVLQGVSTGEILTKSNAMLSNNNEEMMFVTAWLGILDTDRRILEYTNAGHNPPFLLRKGDSLRPLKKNHGTPLGILPGEIYESNKKGLMEGDRLFLYTDGATDVMSEDQRFGEKALQDTVFAYRDSSCEQFLGKIQEEIDQFAGESEQFDDITMMVMDLT